MAKNKIINVQGHVINISANDAGEYISLTDIAKDFGGNDQIKNWIRTRRTIEFLGTWEQMKNPNFNSVEFHRVTYEAGSEKFIMSTTQWVERTGAIGLMAKSGRTGGGTFAHKDIAFEFCSWLSPQFKLYLIEEFQRLKEIETNQYNLEWNVKRVLSKANYRLHTDAIKAHVIPKLNVPKDKEWLVYASEADLLNMAIWGVTAKDWKDNNAQLHLKGQNLRDIASINELAVLSNIESINSLLIKNGVDKKQRFEVLQTTAQEQLKALNSMDFLKALKYTSDGVYVEALEQEKKSEFDTNLKGIIAAGKPPKDPKK